MPLTGGGDGGSRTCWSRCGPVVHCASGALIAASVIGGWNAGISRISCQELSSERPRLHRKSNGTSSGSVKSIAVVSGNVTCTSNNTAKAPTSRFLEQLAYEAVPSWKVHDGDPGVYNGCGERAGQHLMWFLVGGNFRTMNMHTANTLSFLRQSHPCWFVVAFFRRRREFSSSAFFDVGAGARRLQVEYGSNFAFAVTERLNKQQLVEEQLKIDRISDSWPGSVMLSRAVSRAHGIMTHDSDIVITSRPDIIFSHAVKVSALRALAVKPKRFMLLMRHEGEIGGFDPTEAFAITTRSVLESLCEPTRRLACKGRSAKECQLATCTPDLLDRGCGHPYRKVLSLGSNFIGAEVYYIAPTLKVHFHRLNGDYRTAVNRPGNPELARPDSAVRPPLDVTKGVTCEFATLDSCRQDAPHEGPTSFQGVPTKLRQFPFMNGRSYICVQPVDL